MTHDGGFRCAVPILPSLNVRAAAEFYQHKLGFNLLAFFENGPQDQYAILCRDDAEIHLWGVADPYLVQNSGCFLRVEQIESLYAALSASGVVVAAALDSSAQLGRQFSIYDIDGNLVRIGEPLPAEQRKP